MGENPIPQHSSIPAGYEPPYTWVIAINGGELVCRTTGASTVTANLVGGKALEAAISGASTVAVSVDLIVQLVSAITGAAVVTAEITGSIALSCAISGAAAVVGSMGLLTGMTTAISGSSIVTASIVGLASLSCDITSQTELSPDNLASAVWAAIAVSNNDVGTMGEKLNDAGSAGDPWATDTSTYTTPGTFGFLVKKLLTVGKFLGLK